MRVHGLSLPTGRGVAGSRPPSYPSQQDIPCRCPAGCPPTHGRDGCVGDPARRAPGAEARDCQDQCCRRDSYVLQTRFFQNVQ